MLKTHNFFLKSDPRNGACTDTRITVHALLRGGTVKRGNRVLQIIRVKELRGFYSAINTLGDFLYMITCLTFINRDINYTKNPVLTKFSEVYTQALDDNTFFYTQ